MGDPCSTATERAEARVCLALDGLLASQSSRFFSSRVHECFFFAMMCYTGISSQSQRGRPFERAKARSAFRTEETGYIEASPLREITREVRAMAIQLHQPVVCPILVGRSAELTASAGMHRAAATWARRRCAALRGSRHWQIAAGGRTATVCRSSWVPAAGWPVLPNRSSCPYAPLLDLLRAFLAPLSPPRSRRHWEPPHVRSFPCFLSRSSTCLK